MAKPKIRVRTSTDGKCPLNGNRPMTVNTIFSAARCQMNRP
ncbi:Uncharacterised protein [Mycobacteroides abscessus subsp. abscessus]|nr:Uncharacterised protein [Mycobacteroides abscessus subsp. abscessus]